jgi:hypothetical protein
VKRLKSGELWDLAQVREWLEARNPPDTPAGERD